MEQSPKPKTPHTVTPTSVAIPPIEKRPHNWEAIQCVKDVLREGSIMLVIGGRLQLYLSSGRTAPLSADLLRRLNQHRTEIIKLLTRLA